ncbi:Predicted arabinose efflux permease, MFS family [Quadrisphaera granulorum]|uniref:Putative MFS family arabinose efflux permease n=1 Tax=Quadrisphaera granulorum TaxID=317664 RepID=A0A316AC58_9ACTN|nr:MFS transporter [Quadrisphaera granulorum]PWJ55201.1 putative MFS family arabinose efflux permease [Quadrisphaera granulorum]SZE95710.1 Predicted arabinose efflux permease, MFS family [Quadrisphaera granulorum]
MTSPTFQSLTVRNYRIWAGGAIVSNVGTWMQRVAQDWLVLTQLTNNSAVAVGITTALQFGPQLLLGPFTGAVADRFPQRAVLAVTQALMGTWALVLGLLVVLGDPQLWQVYVIAGLLGVTSAFDAPVRQTFVTSLVPKAMLANAVGLNSASFNGARLIGPAVAGLLIAAVGTGWVFLINAATFAATCTSLALMRRSELVPAPRRPRGRGATREGLAYVRSRPDIVLILFVVGLVGAFGMNFQMTTALMARVEFGLGADSYGLLGSIMAIGSLAGALLAARREHPRLRLVVGAAVSFGVFAILASVMPGYWTFAVALIPVGLSALTLMTAANATVQMTTPPELRGRVMALYMAVFAGTTPLGAPLVGWIGEVAGPRWSIAIGGIAALVAAAVVVLVVSRRQEVHVHYRLHERPHFLVQVG